MLTVLRLADQATGPPGAPAASVGPAMVTSVSFRGHRGFPGQVDSCPCLPSQWQLRQGGRHGGDPGAGRQAPLRGEGPPVACRPGATALGVLGRPERGQHSPAAPGPAAVPRGLGGRKGDGDVIAAWNLLFGGVAMETGRLRAGKNSKPKRV